MSAPSATAAVLERLYAVIDSRKGTDPGKSYSAQLLSLGTEETARKVGEEAIEAVIAALRGERHQVLHESADLLYHLMVLWVDQGILPAEVWAELARREGTSGLDEKKARG